MRAICAKVSILPAEALRVHGLDSRYRHANVSITSTYLHVVIDDEDEVGNLFGTATQIAKS